MLRKKSFFKILNRVSIFLSYGALLLSPLINAEAVAMSEQDEGCCCCFKQKRGQKQRAFSKDIWKAYGFKSKKAYTYVANLIEEAISKHPYIYEDTKVIAGIARFQEFTIEGRMIDFPDSLIQGKPWVSLVCPLAEGQEAFLRTLLFYVVSKVYPDPFRLDLVAICRTKQQIGKYIFDQDASDQDKQYTCIAAENEDYYNVIRQGNPLSLI